MNAISISNKSLTGALPADKTVNNKPDARVQPARAQPEPSARVTLSSAALAAVRSEATETPQQTAKEARGNDHQAQRLLAQQAAKKTQLY